METRTPGVLKVAILVSVAVLCLGAGACKRSRSFKVAVTKADAVEGSATGLPVAPPPPVEITADSPDDLLAAHYGISVNEIKRLRELHAAFPVIAAPAGFVAPKEKIEGIPPGSGPMVTDLPGFKVITLGEITGVESVRPAELLEAALAVRRMAFILKVPVFSKPVIFMDPHLENPTGMISLTVGLPVPDDVKLPKGLNVKHIKAGVCGFVGPTEVQPLKIPLEVIDYIKAQTSRIQPNGPCTANLLVLLDQWPEAEKPAVGNTVLLCL